MSQSSEGQDAGARGELTRSEMRLVRHAIRQDWPITPEMQAKLIGTLIAYVDPDSDQCRTAPDRIIIAAAKTLASFGSLALKQQALDLAREKLEGKEDDYTLADLVAAAEERAEERRSERDRDRPLPGA